MSKRELQIVKNIISAVLSLKPEMSALSDDALRHKTDEFRIRLSSGETTDDLLPEAFAVVREAGRRVLGMEHFPVQLMGGAVLHRGGIAEMRTGEGKTLVSTLPAYLNALSGKGVHVVTTNDYLAERDARQMGKLHEFLGLTVGSVLSGMAPEQRREAYHCDITYVTNSELGFDYLRDNMATNKKRLVQRGFHYAIIDEVDSVLIDDARTPLIISGEGSRSTKLYEACDTLARRMSRGNDIQPYSILDSMSGTIAEETGDFSMDEKTKQIILTQAGIRRAERFFRIGNIADLKNTEIQHHMTLALKANYLFERDKDYVVLDGQVLIVDALTGRIMAGRRYSDGLHQAIEAKEHVRIRKESRTSASVTYQNFFRKYEKLSGMTGTGRSSKQEFSDVYGMEIIEIPTNRPVQRIDREDLIFRTREEKLRAVCRDVLACRESGRPILIGTLCVSDSEELSHMLTALEIHHNVLNAKQHAKEAAIVAEAGRHGAVTIATNMAGRGTDIKLDDEAKCAGGLLVIGTERYESRRSDGQLSGRAGRQGDPGESRFYLSLDDGLLRLYGSSRLTAIFNKLSQNDGQGVSHPSLTKAAERAQKELEGEHYAQRRKVLEYDGILNHQRELIYAKRLQVLEAEDISSIISEMMPLIANDAASRETESGSRQAVLDYLKGILSPGSLSSIAKCPVEKLCSLTTQELLTRFHAIEHSYGDAALLECRERDLILQIVDKQWAAHLENMDHLRQGIGLLSYAQKDPIVEYRKAAFQMFEQLNQGIRLEAAMALLSTGEVKIRS